MNKEYAEKVEVLLRLLPIVMDEKVFAVHGGSAINLFVRDLFDVKYMEYPLAETREGLLFCLLGSDRPLHESFAPNLIDQHDALANQFDGMTDVPFTYEEFEQTRSQLIQDVFALMTAADKSFLVSFEQGEPDWDNFDFSYFKDYPSVQWKLLNLQHLKKQNPIKLTAEASKLQSVFG
jgi:hypothetical protein